jgi:probable O-glycosylation ligase (exosortase A-associated)
MALRQFVAAPILAILVGKTLHTPKFGVSAFLVILLLDPSNLWWGFDSWHIPMILSVALLLSTLVHASDRNKGLAGGAIFTWWVLLAIFLVFSAIDSVNVERSWRVLIDYWVKTFILAWFVMLWLADERDIRRFFYVIVGSFFLLVVRAMYRYSVGYPELSGLAGTMLDRNDFALNLMMVAPIAFVLARTSRTRLERSGFLITTILLFLCTALTFSRMGFLLMLTAGFMVWNLGGRKMRGLLFIAAVSAIVLLILPETYFERMSGIQQYEQDASAMGRLVAWEGGIRMGADNLLTGVGLKCFELPEVFRSYFGTTKPYVSHNAYIQLFSEAGLPALLSWVFLMLAAILSGRRVARETASGEVQQLAKAISYALALYLIGSIFLNSAYFELPYVLLGSFVALRRHHRIRLEALVEEPEQERRVQSGPVPDVGVQ